MPITTRVSVQPIWTNNSPDTASATSAVTTDDGGGKKRASSRCTRTRISHNAMTMSGDAIAIATLERMNCWTRLGGLASGGLMSTINGCVMSRA